MGIPDVAGLDHDALLTPTGGLYMRRYWIHRAADGTSERYHHILVSDADPHMHDHPWDFDTLILDGSYTEHTATGSTVHPEGTRLHRDAIDAHRLDVDAPVWTHVTTSPFLRTWGFHTPDGWVDWRTYKGLPPPRRRTRTKQWTY
jgi:hypothetical protein